ncbi:MAG: aminopeptidase [Candidatus Heimdallarchaeota archaeon]
MYGDFNEKLAKLVVEYAVGIEPNDLVYITSPANAEGLIREVYREAIKAGGHVIKTEITIPGTSELFYKYATEEQIKYVDSLTIEFAKKVTKSIHIYSSYNTRALTNIDPKLKTMPSVHILVCL